MEKLLEQLERNVSAMEHLDWRIQNIKTLEFYRIFSNEYRRHVDIQWILKVQKRVLRMRYRILENIQKESLKQMNYTSQLSRELNLKIA